MTFETPWFLKSKTTDVGRANQIVDERLQRSVTELEFKARKSLMKIDRRIDTILEEYKGLREDVDFSTDLDEEGKPLDAEELKTKSATEKMSKRKLQQKLLKNAKASQSAKTGSGYKIKPRKEKHTFSTQELIEKLQKMKEREEMREWTLSPQFKMPSKVYKLKPIEGVTNKISLEITIDETETKEKPENGENKASIINELDNDRGNYGKEDVDLKLIGVVKDANIVPAIDTIKKKGKKRKKKKDKRKL